MSDQKSVSTERKRRTRNKSTNTKKKKTLIDKLKLEFTSKKPGKETLKKFYNGII